jgi:class 3 adenylate cyclase
VDAGTGVPDAESAGSRSASLRDPLAWSAAGRCLFAASAYLLVTVWYWLALESRSGHPDAAPYISATYLPTALVVLRALVGLWVGLVAAALAARRLRPDSQLLVRVTVAACIAQLAWGSWLFGTTTSLFSGLAILGSLTLGLVFFDRKLMLRAFGVLFAFLAALMVGERTGHVVHAPIFSSGPFRDGVLHPTWMFQLGGATVLLMLLCCSAIYFVIERWREREAQLAETGEQLARSNEIISRYVASQLAEQIQAGQYDVLARHDRRRLTLFFSDIEGFAEIADRNEPEDLSERLNEYLSEMTGIAERHGATIDKFVGDAIVIFFGAPVATDDRDHALRAVRMAVEMQARLVELREKWQRQGAARPFHVRMGINTGQASVGNFGSRRRMDYTAIGRQVNLAARLQAQCRPDGILLSHSTWALVKDELHCEPKGEIVVKGFHEPVLVYEVV